MISRPVCHKHSTHVTFNQKTMQFEGLPNEWGKLFQQSGFNEEELQQN